MMTFFSSAGPWQQQNFEIIFQLCHILTFFADFLLYHLLEVRIGDGFFEQGFGLRQMVPGGLPVAVACTTGCVSW